MDYKLEDIFDLQMGKTPARNNPEYWNSEDHKWISIADLSKCGKYIEDTKEYLSDKAVKELERILTVDLGNKEDYQREFGETPFGLLVRKIAKLDHDAAMAAFSGFINEENLNAQQINFVQKVISYVEQNGYMEDISVLLRAPFDKPTSFVRLFAAGQQRKLVDTINQIKKNAEVVA